MNRSILVGGQQILIEADVAEHSLTFPTAKPRTVPVDLIVLHDTAGEGSGLQVHSTLSKKLLSIHYVVDRDGLIWQFLDPAKYSAAHAGKGNNSRSVGIEIANAVFPPGIKPGLFSSVKQYALTGKERLFGRPVIVDGYRGTKRRVLGHMPAQIKAVRSLVQALLIAFPTVRPKVPRGIDDKIHGELLPPGWQGVCGHLHLTDAHVDPAMDVLHAVGGMLS